jgi:hypothetical protein
MPKLNGIHIFERLRERLEQLEAGEEIAAKEIRSLLTPEQQQELEDAWKEQQELRKGKRARTAEEEKELGWKTKREVRIEVFKRALKAADDGVDKEFERLQAEATKRQLKIYFEALDEAKKLGKDNTEAENYANNELTRAGIRRMDYLQKLIEEIKQKRLVERYMRLAGGGNG